MSEPEVTPQHQLVGLGALPAELKRPNWVAFAFGPLWAIAYRVWPVLWMYVGLVLVDVVLQNLLLWLDKALWERYAQLDFYVALLLWRVLSVWVSLNANRLLWARESASPVRPLGSYKQALRSWTAVAAVFLALDVVNTATLIVQGHRGVVFGVARAAIIFGLLAYDRLVVERKLTSAST